jgi:hypothetical protein
VLFWVGEGDLLAAQATLSLLIQGLRSSLYSPCLSTTFSSVFSSVFRNLGLCCKSDLLTPPAFTLLKTSGTSSLTCELNFWSLSGF